MTVPPDINVLDKDGAAVAMHAPLPPGRVVAAESRPVALSTEDYAALTALATLLGDLKSYTDGLETLTGTTNSALTAISSYVDGLEALASSLNGYVDGLESQTGATNEAAPASDTAASGLNGRLQRIAQRLTTLLSAGAATIAKAEDAASADADVGVPAMAVRKATPANTSGADGDYEMLQISNGRLWVSAALEAGSALLGRTVADASAAAGGVPSTARLASAAATTNGAVAKASAGRLYAIQGKNNAAYDVFLCLYDAAAAPTVGTTALRKKLCLPAGSAFALDFPLGLSFATGISYALTKLVADNDATAVAAGDVTALNLDYA